uniref:Nectin cell adhesion molecule 3b n=1 Tax=Labrus bergylta TaxID=56723 RepID=A0A3Q3EBM2_9LABR
LSPLSLLSAMILFPSSPLTSLNTMSRSLCMGQSGSGSSEGERCPWEEYDIGLQVEVGTNLTLTQSSWERRLPSGSVTVAVYTPRFGISIPPEFIHRLYFRSPSSHDATIVLENVGFADVGIYTCKVATFPLGNTQASTTVNVLGTERSTCLQVPRAIDGGNDTVVATCIAERALSGLLDEANGTTSTQVRYLWQPTRHIQGHTLTCVVRHPALNSDFRIPYQLNVQFSPDISVVGYDGDWYVGRENVQMACKANANPPAHHFRWIRLDSEMPEGVEILNSTLLFLRPLQRNDSGVYRCEVANDIGLRSRDVRILIQDPPTMPSTITAPVLTGSASSTVVDEKGHVLLSSPTLEALPESNLGSIVGGAVGGALFLLLLLCLVGVFYLRKQQTFHGDYYTKQYLGNNDLQKRERRLHNNYNGEDPRQARNTRYPRSPKPQGNGSPYMSDDCYDSGPEGDYVSHRDGSVISRREWYV